MHTLHVNVCTRRAGARAHGRTATLKAIPPPARTAQAGTSPSAPSSPTGLCRPKPLTAAASSKGRGTLSLALSLSLPHSRSQCLSLSRFFHSHFFCLSLEAPPRWAVVELPPPGDREPPPGVACAPEVAAPCAAGGGPAVAAVGTGDFGFTVKPKTKTKSSCTDASTFADACVQTMPPVPAKAMPPKPLAFKAPPPMPAPPPPTPSTTKFGVGSLASTGGLSEALTT